jgi:hypothetical protein
MCILTDFADLEINLEKAEGGMYGVEMRFTQPKSDADTRVGADVPITVQFDLQTLQDLIADPTEYGKTLSSSLFAVEQLRTGFLLARTSADGAKVPLHVRFLIGPSCPELNTLYWETLLDPADNKSQLFTNENVLFSRYLASSDWRSVQLRARGDLKALVAASNPSDLASYNLAPVDVVNEIARAKEALTGTPVLELGITEFCTLNKLLEKMRDGVDILYLVAHGTSAAGGEPRIWLQGEDGKAVITSAEDIVAQIKELQILPRLIVLASCQSAGKGVGPVLQAFGPRLAQAGVPAVLAMQGNISMESIKNFMPVFFSELFKDGQIDRALAVARGTVRTMPDFWIPVLFMRLKSGKVWYVPGVGDGGEDFDKWPAIISNIQDDECTPILGPGMYESLLGTMQQMAQSLSTEFNFPLSTFLSDSMPDVAQYISVNQDFPTLKKRFLTLLRLSLQKRFSADLPDELKVPTAKLLDLFTAGGAKARERNPNEPHKVLANLPIRIYITTNYDNLMADALKEAGKAPEVVICPWSDRFEVDSVYTNDPDYLPTVERPLVYHLFGHLSEPDSMVLTEDDYFEFLTGFTSNKKRSPWVIPPAVLRAVNDAGLLILGFRLDDWTFRALFRTIKNQTGAQSGRGHSHVGVQIALDDTRNQNPTRARQYFEKYFDQTEINLYWGNSQDFLADLAKHWAAAKE